MSCIGTVIQNYFKISNASYMPYIIPYEFIYKLRIVASETLHVLLENWAWRILSRPPGTILRLVILLDACATCLLMTRAHTIFLCQKLCNAAIEVFTSIKLTISMGYRTRRFNAALTSALQWILFNTNRPNFLYW